MTRETIADVHQRFVDDTQHHVALILHDDGPYRHVRFKQADTREYWFDLVTWPGHLSFTGDVGPGYTFARDPDMFDFFRVRSGWRLGTISPDYWAGKIVTGRDQVKRYSKAQVCQHIVDIVDDLADELPGLAGAVLAELRSDVADLDSYEGAREALEEFEYLPTQAEILDRGSKRPFRFEDVWEWDTTDWDWSYLWACNAIQWGIGQYDALKTGTYQTPLPRPPRIMTAPSWPGVVVADVL